MKKNTSIRWLTLFSFGIALSLMASFLPFQKDASYFSADILTSEESSFYLWYLEDAIGEQEWDIPMQIGSVVELPLGLSINGNNLTALPMDSVEFRISGLPSYLTFESVSSYPGFHVDTLLTKSNIPGKTDLTLYITPEVFNDNPDGTPGAPDDINEIGDLIEASAEVLRARFVVSDTPLLASPLSVEGILTARDGDFTRYIADGNLSFPGDNAGIIALKPLLYSGALQIVAARAISDTEVQLEFTGPVLAGESSIGSENNTNYFIYACGAHIPAPDSSDVNANDTESCRLFAQENVLDPGEPISAVRDDNHTYLVTVESSDVFEEGIKYIIRVDNVANDTAEITIPDDGIYSQVFSWKAHPLVSSVTALSDEDIEIVFTAPVCAANSLKGAGRKENYMVLACNEDTSIWRCIHENENQEVNPEVLEVSFDYDKTVVLTVDTKAPNAAYVVLVKNVADNECADTSAIPEYPPYYSSQFFGTFLVVDPPAGDNEGEMALAIGFSGSTAFHLPWREKIPLNPLGGVAPYTWEVVPPEAGIIDDSDSNEPFFAPALSDINGNPIHDERDIVLRVTDANGDIASFPVHILRRGDLGGDPPLFLDKTDVQDVNDVSAGWKR